MSTNRKATMAKRQREMAQKDRVKDREQRRAERDQRRAERKASGIVGPDMGEPITNDDSDLPAGMGAIIAMPLPLPEN